MTPKEKVSHIIRVESKSISYHTISLSFYLSLFLPAKTRIKKAICQNLHSNSQPGTDCLEPFPDCLPSTALEASIVSTSYASREDTTYARRTDKARENGTLKYVETSTTSMCRFIRYFFKIKSISSHQGCNHSGFDGLVLTFKILGRLASRCELDVPIHHP
ncbi:hypothetical protein ACFX12_029923 [Malus domestica]